MLSWFIRPLRFWKLYWLSSWIAICYLCFWSCGGCWIFSRELREQSAPFLSANGNHHGCRHKLSKALSQMDGGVCQKTKTFKMEAFSLKKAGNKECWKRLFKRNLLQIDYIPKNFWWIPQVTCDFGVYCDDFDCSTLAYSCNSNPSISMCNCPFNKYTHPIQSSKAIL